MKWKFRKLTKYVGILTKIKLERAITKIVQKWWAVAESNCGHEAFQASALPTELTAHNFKLYTFRFSTVKQIV